MSSILYATTAAIRSLHYSNDSIKQAVNSKYWTASTVQEVVDRKQVSTIANVLLEKVCAHAITASWRHAKSAAHSKRIDAVGLVVLRG